MWFFSSGEGGLDMKTNRKKHRRSSLNKSKLETLVEEYYFFFKWIQIVGHQRVWYNRFRFTQTEVLGTTHSSAIVRHEHRSITTFPILVTQH